MRLKLVSRVPLQHELLPLRTPSAFPLAVNPPQPSRKGGNPRVGLSRVDGCLISSPDAVISRRLQEQTQVVLATLTQREQLVLRLRFGIAQIGEQPQEKSEEMLTPDQMAFIEATALRKLRHPRAKVPA